MSAPTYAPPRPPRTEAPRRAPRRSPDRGATRRTLLAVLAAALGIVPLKGLFSDNAWLIDVWVSMIVVVGPAALIRLRRAPGALDIWPGIVLLVPWLTVRFLGDTAFLGVIPTGSTWTQLSLLMTDLHETTREEVAPIHTTVAVRVVLCALVGLLAALIDLIAVVGRRGALAGVPLLVVYTVAGAVPRQPVAWVWFAFAAVGYLVLLALDAGDDVQNWGRRVRADGGGRARTALSVTTPRIAAAAVVAAVLLPLLVPGEPRNLLSDAFHGGNSDGLGGFGGGGNGGKITPFSALKGQLTEKKPRKLADVTMLSRGDTTPFYLRVNVLSSYTDEGWRVAPHGQQTGIANDDYPVLGGGSPTTVGLEARIRISGMRGNAPVFNLPDRIDGLGPDTTWAAQDQLLLGSSIDDGLEFTESFQQPVPTTAQLEDAPATIDDAVRSQLEVPADLPSYARNLVRDLTANSQSQYAKARAISDYFADPVNAFTYDLQTDDGDSGSDLVDFLQNRRGFCQQYAAAMAVMLRTAGVPARVVLGYLHPKPDANGRFSVSTTDAHSWAEAWFAGIGWIPFDPTPSSTLAGGGSSLPWAPHAAEDTGGPTADTSSGPSTSASRPSTSAAPSSSATVAPKAAPSDSSSPIDGWVAGGVVLALLLALLPAGTRWSRRRRRYGAARRTGDADPLWDELTDTAVDLGYVWSSARSPRQVAAWLAEDAPASAPPLDALATAVEQRRYAVAVPARGGVPGGPDGAELVESLREVTDSLRAARSGRTRLRARFWPASLGWTSPFGGRGAEARRRL